MVVFILWGLGKVNFTDEQLEFIPSVRPGGKWSFSYHSSERTVDWKNYTLSKIDQGAKYDCEEIKIRCVKCWRGYSHLLRVHTLMP